MHAREKRRAPNRQIVRRKTEQSVSEIVISQGHRPKENLPILAAVANRGRLSLATRFFFEQEYQHRNEQSGKAQEVESPAPTYVLADPTTKKEYQARADG